MIDVRRLYSEGFDLETVQPDPDLNYMVASIPRSGSTFLLLRLWGTGVLGAPLEYFNPQLNQDLLARFGAGDLALYWTELQKRRSSRNGAFGYKMFIKHYAAIGAERPDVLSLIRPASIVYYRRADTVAQAVSYARAVWTGAWTAGCDAAPAPEYDFDLIRRQETLILFQERAWHRIFERMDMEPLEVLYEDLLRDEAEVVSRIAGHVGVTLDPALEVQLGPLEVQADALSHAWIARYREDLTARSLNPEMAC